MNKPIVIGNWAYELLVKKYKSDQIYKKWTIALTWIINNATKLEANILFAVQMIMGKATYVTCIYVLESESSHSKPYPGVCSPLPGTV